ncbi:amidohydrolase family protein [Melioribacteraceae bacterium 4301-Me]|uniref:amidohydrolase family protein n=1 Tax=Pyranulibacter aquaticus TaxID=3163344 RepID=UPI0035997599
MRKKFLLFSLLITSQFFAQETFPINGVQNKNHNYYGFTNATIFVDYKTKLENATLLIQDGKVVDVGSNINIPKGTVIYDLKGKFIYPALIDIYSNYGEPLVHKEAQQGIRKPQIERTTKGAFGWNQAIRPEVNAEETFAVDKKSAEELRKLGFGSVLTSQMDGIARGTAAFVCLGDQLENEMVVLGKSAALYSFDKGSSKQDYPSSLMGAIALLRQSYLDAQWYKQSKDKTEFNISLEAWNDIQSLPQIFEVNDWQSALRADKIGDEFNVQYIIKGSGDEYQRIDEIKKTNAQFIIPVNFPEAYDVEDPYNAVLVSLAQMKHWELAPLNPATLEKNSIEFSLTAYGLKNKNNFWKNLRKAIEYGLSEQTALKALTFNPAKMLGLENQIGSLKKGMIANFIITSANLFDPKNIIYENWIKGIPYHIADYDLVDIRGVYDLKVGSRNYKLSIEGDINKPKATVTYDTMKIAAVLNIMRRLISLSFDDKKTTGVTRLSGIITENPLQIKGNGQLGSGDWVEWKAVFISPIKLEEKKSKEKKPLQLGDIIYPFQAYGKKQVPEKPKDMLIKNATVWTCENEGILKNTDVYLKDGKIYKIGKSLSPEKNDVEIIDATGMHLTPGIIDEHSHIAISGGVNEGTQASSAEVRIGDVINSEDINIYRALAGGVVAAQLLHGSANPIGGQSGIVKLRWGKTPDEMKIKNASPFIKFALGENVKQSNWGDFMRERFPQTRMGVEQVYVDYFTRAREYENKWKEYNSLSASEKTKASPPRRDLELEAIDEILNKKRFITCHSYVQSEINMLMKVADRFGFNVNTFTHILEGYKVADKMKAHGAGGSTFSDWWDYKFEVYEAIPYNAAIMHDVGVIVAINSDDPEMGRRLNQEAGKTVKYGGVPEEEALKFVTINPAKLLHLDNRIGSIKVGKDADVVLWTNNPLSIYARVIKTIIDGICYFDAKESENMTKEIQKERARLISKMIEEKKSGEPVQKPEKKDQIIYQCDTIVDNYMNEL